MVNAFGLVIVSVETFPKRSVTLIESVDVSDDALTLKKWVKESVQKLGLLDVDILFAVKAMT